MLFFIKFSEKMGWMCGKYVLIFFFKVIYKILVFRFFFCFKKMDLYDFFI